MYFNDSMSREFDVWWEILVYQLPATLTGSWIIIISINVMIIIIIRRMHTINIPTVK